MHTPEPWIVECGDDEADWAGFWPTVSAHGVSIIGTEGFYAETREQSIEDARRVVACVNACKGLSTEVLENILMMGDTILSRIEALKQDSGHDA